MTMVNHLCCVQHLFETVQTERMENKTVAKKQKKQNKKKKNHNWLRTEQVSLTASKDTNFSSRIPNKLCSQPTLLFNGCQRNRLKGTKGAGEVYTVL